jgi:hypothetical protein
MKTQQAIIFSITILNVMVVFSEEWFKVKLDFLVPYVVIFSILLPFSYIIYRIIKRRKCPICGSLMIKEPKDSIFPKYDYCENCRYKDQIGFYHTQSGP